MKTIEDLKRVLNSLELCTQPVDGHTDPNSVNDCWNEVKDQLQKLDSDAQEACNIIGELLDLIPYEFPSNDVVKWAEQFYREHNIPADQPENNIDDLPF